MSSHLAEFGLLAGAHILAVCSPGPDFALVTRQSLIKGRAAALRSSLGIGSGILVHVTYSLFGVGLLIQKSPAVFSVIKWVGTAYLCWIAWQCLRPRPAPVVAPSGEQKATEAKLAQPAATNEQVMKDQSVSESGGAQRGAWLAGFLTNVLNPKATLFFLALFTAGVSPDTPRWLIALYGLWMAVATAAWFSFVSILFTREGLRERFVRRAVLIDRITGVVLLLFAVRLALA